MLFFRKFTHQLLPILLLALGAVVFCVFSYQPLSSSLNQVQVLSRAGYQEMFYSYSPYEVEKKDTFGDLDMLGICVYGRYSMSCDMYLALPGYSYSSDLPFYEEAISTIRPGECLVSENALALRHVKVGDDLLYKGVDEDKPLKIVGKLPSMKGLKHNHHGVIVIAHDPHIEGTIVSNNGKYLTFGRDFKNFGNIKVDGNILLKQRDIDREQGYVVPRIALGLSIMIVSQTLIALLWASGDKREKRALIISGARRHHVFWYFARKKLLYRLLPIVLVFGLFTLMNLVYLGADLVLLSIFVSTSILLGLLETIYITWRA